ncbi:MAG: insulinase family protein, partial [Olsenella sp.]|nr:insulinase family protein [Olsenella sp.]
NLANSYTILYGDLDIDRELAFIDKRFQGAKDRGAGEPNPLTLQAPVTPPTTRVEMATAPENASVGLGYVIGTAADCERVLAVDIMLDALAGSNESPLKKAVLDSGLGDDFTASLVDSELQPQILFRLKGAKPGAAEEFRSLIEKTCAQMAADGIDRTRLEASLAQADFNLRENDWSTYGNGVALSMRAMTSWLYDDDRPVDYLRYEDRMSRLREGLEGTYFEDLLREAVCESNHSAMVELVPVEEGSAAEEAAELAERKAQMSAGELDAVIAEVAALRAEQSAPDAPEALATLPQLSVSDIEDAPREKPLERVEAPLPCLYHDLETHRIDYVYHYFDLRRLSYEDLPYVGVLMSLLGKLGTRRHTAAELDTLVELNLGSLDFFCETYSKDDDLDFAHPMLVVGASSLSERVDELATIPREVWGETDFSDTDRMLSILTQRRISMAQYFTNAGHAAAIARLVGHFAKHAIVAGAMSGIDHYLFLKDLLAHWDERKDDLAERLASLAARIFTADEVTVSFTGPREDMERFWEVGSTLGLERAGEACAHALEAPAPEAGNEAFVIPSNVCYVAEGCAPSDADEGDVGTWQVVSRALSYGYLWNEVRVKGGAYGTGFRHSTSGLMQFWSYRDPNLAGTLERYERAAEWLGDWSGADGELDGYIVSVVAAHDAPATSRAIARRQDGEFFSERPEGWRNHIREQKLSVTEEKIRGVAPALAELASRRSLVVFGPREAIEASGIDFKVTTLMDEE